MARYIDADALAEELKSLQVTITGIRVGKGYLREVVREYQKSVLKIVHEAPTADVVPRVECDKWYHEYHVIKEALKQEKEYYRATEKLADKYFVEFQTKKTEVAREIFKEIEKVIGNKYEYYVFDNRDIEGVEQDAIIAFADAMKKCYAKVKKKYTEGE